MTRTTEPEWASTKIIKQKGLINHPKPQIKGKLVIDPKRENFVRRIPHSGPMIGPTGSSTSVEVMWCVVSFGMQVEVMMQVDMLLFSFVNATKFLCFP